MIETNKIYCGDCLELMKQLDENSINLIITSPPYNINIDYGEEYSDNLSLEQYKESI